MINIELIDNGKKADASTSAVLPVNCLTIGAVYRDDLQIYMKQDVCDRLETYSSLDTGIEVGSILVGDYIKHGEQDHIVISAYIEAKYTDASVSSLTFTHETWKYVHNTLDAKYSDKKIVGWQHTHPGYGVFLSGYDVFIQENFFNLPWQTAYVIDPIAATRGFFYWKDDKVSKLEGYYIYA